jgi:hypothetical protein
MMEKYYTPTIEEFHVGFEYQHNGASTKPKEEQEWSETRIANGLVVEGAEYDMSDDPPENEREARRNGFRVKHLDREDIESLGDTKHEGSLTYFTNNEVSPMTIDLSDMPIIKIVDIMSSRQLFSGTIKNKSELKRLLKQLGL